MELIIAGVVLFVIWLILRELSCWYFKINRIVYLLEQIEQQSHSERR